MNKFLLLLLLPIGLIAQPADQVLDAAKRKIAARNYVEAKAELTKFIGTNPKDRNAFTLRGRSRIGLQDYYGAIGDFNFALEIDSTWAEAFIIA